jgi:hypothetical protein
VRPSRAVRVDVSNDEAFEAAIVDTEIPLETWRLYQRQPS